jgi:hypothetical protein
MLIIYTENYTLAPFHNGRFREEDGLNRFNILSSITIERFLGAFNLERDHKYDVVIRKAPFRGALKVEVHRTRLRRGKDDPKDKLSIQAVIPTLKRAKIAFCPFYVIKALRDCKLAPPKIGYSTYYVKFNENNE